MNKKIIYLDNASTTKIYPEVLNSYNEVCDKFFGNCSSIHGLGVKSSALLAKSREQILKSLKLNDYDLVFTSGATEANNLALKGYCKQYKNRGKHIIVSRIEHPSILETAKQLEAMEGFEVTYLPVNSFGVIDLNDLKNAIRKDTILVSIMAVNNEVGSINDIHEISKIVRKYPKIAFHCDAVQSLGKIDIDYNDCDLITITSHKIHGPLGIGALVMKKRISLTAEICGGGQEDGLRSGTSNLPGAVAFAKAVRIAQEKIVERFEQVSKVAIPLHKYVMESKDLYEINSFGHLNPYIINFSLKNKKASVVVEALSNQNIIVSSISACHSKGEKASYVVMEMGKDEWISHNTLRISLSEENTVEEMLTFINALIKIVGEIRS